MKNKKMFINFPFIRFSLIDEIILSFFIYLFSFFMFSSCSKTPTKPEGITISGRVVLEDTTDYSGVTVSLYKPVELDTAITNELQKHPGVGIEINQRTEFFWREHKPVYTTTTNAQGEWKIENVNPGSYNLVIRSPNYGWRVLYNVDGGKFEINLKKPIIWKGNINHDVTVPENSFVIIIDDTYFNSGTNLTIKPRTILEFQNDAKLEIHGNVEINGEKGSEIYIVPEDTINDSKIRIINNDKTIINNICSFYLKNGIYLNSIDSVVVKNSRFRMQNYAIELFNCIGAIIKNNVISNMIDGLISQENQLFLKKSIIINNQENGLRSLSANNSLIKNNILKNCRKNGIALNVGGYGYKKSYLQILYNDFILNKIDIYINEMVICTSNNNNYLQEQGYVVLTTAGSLNDTLNFKENYWGTTNIIEIKNKIYDGIDRQSQNNVGAIIDYNNFKLDNINW